MYKKKLHNMNRVIERQKKTIRDLNSLITKLKDMRFLDQHALDLLNSVAAPNKEFLMRQLSTASDITSQKSYSADLREFALTLHFYSPAAYSYIRGTFQSSLPHPTTISRWYSKIDAEPGFTTESINALKEIVKSTPHKIICSLVMDEMALKHGVDWDGTKYNGFVNMGGQMQADNLPLATNVFVFMLVGVNCSWKIPVGYFFIKSLSTEQRCNLINQCLILLHDTGIKVVSLTCDGLSTNLSVARELGCDFNLATMKPTFKHPITNEDIAFFLDPCHMLKLVRNTIGQFQYLYNKKNEVISWSYITKLHEYQISEGLKLGNKLSNHHIHFINQKMKVKLAAQVLSASVADAIEFCDLDLNVSEFKGSKATVEFLRNFNDLFDILNSRNLKHFGFKQPLNEQNSLKIIENLNRIYDYICNLKLRINGPVILEEHRKTGFLGFLICIKSIIHLYMTLVKSDSPLLKFLPMYKFSQDHLEIFFSFIRYQGGWNNNPTCRQFRSAYKKLLVKAELKQSKSANCFPLEEIKILNVSSKKDPIEIINSSLETNLINEKSDFFGMAGPTDSTDHDYVYSPSNLSEFSLTIIEFIAGYVAKQLINILKCEQCISALTTSSPTYEISLIKKKTKGGLKYPSDDLYKVCRMSEKFFRLKTKINEKNLTKCTVQSLLIEILKSFQHDKNIFSSLNSHMHDTSPLENHAVQLIRAIAQKI